MVNSKDKIKRYFREEAPANSMGASSSVAGTGAIDMFDPVMDFHRRKQMDDLKAYLDRLRKQQTR